MTDSYQSGFLRDEDGALVVAGPDGASVGGGGGGSVHRLWYPEEITPEADNGLAGESPAVVEAVGTLDFTATVPTYVEAFRACAGYKSSADGWVTIEFRTPGDSLVYDEFLADTAFTADVWQRGHIDWRGGPGNSVLDETIRILPEVDGVYSPILPAGDYSIEPRFAFGDEVNEGVVDGARFRNLFIEIILAD